MRARIWIALVALAFGLMASGCGGEPEGATATSGGAQRTSAVIDEERGSYRDVVLGSTARDVEHALGLGKPIRLMSGGPATPIGIDPWDYRGPVSTSGPVPDDDSELLGLRYPELVVMIDDDRVVTIETMEAGATTARGVSVGDPIERAAAAYPELECGTIDDWRACQGRLGYRHLWFGGDPISVIAIGSVRLEGL